MERRVYRPRTEASEGTNFVAPLILDFQKRLKINLCYSSCPVSGTLLWQLMYTAQGRGEVLESMGTVRITADM
jgi:hypothetical protein